MDGASQPELIFNSVNLDDTASYAVQVSSGSLSTMSSAAVVSVRTPSYYSPENALRIDTAYNSPVFDVEGTHALSGTNYYYQAWIGGVPDDLFPLHPPLPFRAGSRLAGHFLRNLRASSFPHGRRKPQLMSWFVPGNGVKDDVRTRRRRRRRLGRVCLGSGLSRPNGH
jgi:hypothetical protein